MLMRSRGDEDMSEMPSLNEAKIRIVRLSVGEDSMNQTEIDQLLAILRGINNRLGDIEYALRRPGCRTLSSIGVTTRRAALTV